MASTPSILMEHPRTDEPGGLQNLWGHTKSDANPTQQRQQHVLSGAWYIKCLQQVGVEFHF